MSLAYLNLWGISYTHGNEISKHDKKAEKPFNEDLVEVNSPKGIRIGKE